ncbi:MAG: rhodanese-related sulfurtransferase [Myxococcota bacterium]
MDRCAIVALYAFAELPDYAQLQAPVRLLCEQEQIVGTILLAAEGFNGTVAGPPAGMERLVEWLRARLPDASMEVKTSYAAAPPFGRMRVRLKKEIVTMGVPDIDPLERVGTYVEPEDWNALIADPEVLVVDTRNDYEVRIGTFEGATDPKTKSFRDFPAWAAENVDPGKHKKVAMFCTGGIRCEKATSLLLREGVEEVFHLKGGILRYLERVPAEQSTWTGECFVFDRRVAVNHALEPGEHVLCYGCLEPLAPEELEHPDYEEGVCCHRCVGGLDEDTRARRRERMKQVAVAKARGHAHLHVGPSPDEL